MIELGLFLCDGEEDEDEEAVGEAEVAEWGEPQPVQHDPTNSRRDSADQRIHRHVQTKYCSWKDDKNSEMMVKKQNVDPE